MSEHRLANAEPKEIPDDAGDIEDTIPDENPDETLVRVDTLTGLRDLTAREAELAQAFIHGHRVGEGNRTVPLESMTEVDE